MKRMLHEFRVVWNCAFALHYRGMFKYVIWFSMGLLVIFPAIIWSMTHDFHKALGAVTGPSFILFLCIWITLPAGAIRQNSAAHARLVPRLHKRLIQLTVAVALIGISINALFLSFMQESYGWCFVALLFFTVGTGWGQMRHFGWPIALIVIAHRAIIDNLPRDVVATLTSDNALILWLILGLLLGAFFIKSIFPRGGDRSWHILKNVQRQLSQAKDPFAINRDAGKLAFAPYNHAFRVACAQRSNNLAMLTLGPNCHWGILFVPLLVVVISVALLKGLLLAFPDLRVSGFIKSIGWMAPSILIMMQFAAQNTALQFSKTRMEQSLYRLGAHAPPANMLNHRLALGIVRAKLQGFFLTLLVALACSMVMSVSHDNMIIQCAICCLTLPFICLHLRDYSREAMMNTGYARIWQFVGFFIVAPVIIFLLVVPAPLSAWITIAMTCSVSSALLIAYRWHKMVASPVVFPAGRFGT